MAFLFVTMLLAATVVLGSQATEVSSDGMVMLQVGVSAKAKKLTHESALGATLDGEASAPKTDSSCPSMSDIPDALLMHGATCTSVTEMHVAGKPARSQSKADIVTTSVEQTALAVEQTALAVEKGQDTSFVMRCILNLFSLAVVANILRRLCSNTSESVDKAPADMPSCTSRRLAPSEWATIFRAAQGGDVVAVEALLQQGLPLNGEDNWGCTVLHAAAKGGQAAVTAQLLERGVMVDALDAWDESPLHYAARAGSIDVCKLLLARGARVDMLNAQDWTPLVAAADAGKRTTCQWLRAHGATHGDLEESQFPPLLQDLLKPEELESEPETQIIDLEAKQEADLLRRILEAKPECEDDDSVSPQWEDDDSAYY